MLLLGTIRGITQTASTASRPILTEIYSEAPPQTRNGRTFVPLRTITNQFHVEVLWVQSTSTVVIRRPDQASIFLTINSTVARIGNQLVTLDAAPYLQMNTTMVPLRFIAESLSFPVDFDAATNSIYIHQDSRIYVLPLNSATGGIRIIDPRPGELVSNPILVQGQANVYEGALIIEVREASGRLLRQTSATAGMGGFYPYSTYVYYSLASKEPVKGRVIVYSINGKGDGRRLAQASVDVMLASTRY